MSWDQLLKGQFQQFSASCSSRELLRCFLPTVLAFSGYCICCWICLMKLALISAFLVSTSHYFALIFLLWVFTLGSISWCISGIRWCQILWVPLVLAVFHISSSIVHNFRSKLQWLKSNIIVFSKEDHWITQNNELLRFKIKLIWQQTLTYIYTHKEYTQKGYRVYIVHFTFSLFNIFPLVLQTDLLRLQKV